MTQASFDLREAPWIPVRDQEGRNLRVGLRQALCEAHLFVGLAGPSPLATFALHRLLLAFLHRSLNGPRGEKAWRALRDAGHFPAESVQSYLLQWGHRLDLLHPERPFYQVAGLPLEGAGPVSKLFQERSSGNNAVWFDHSWDEQGRSLSFADAALQLLVVQNFSLGGLVSFAKGADPGLHKSAKSALMVGHAGFLVGGANLFECLVNNLVAYNPSGNRPFEGQSEADCPAWEREKATWVEERFPDGYLDLLTWQARRVLLVPSEDGSCVAQAVVYKGEPLPEGYELRGKDPALAFRKASDPKAPNPFPPLGFRPDKALWRDATALLGARPQGDGGPRVLAWLRDASIDGPVSWPLGVYGLANDKAKAEFWREEHLIWPTAYLGEDEALGNRLKEALSLAEQVAKLLGSGYVEASGKVEAAPFRVLGNALRVRDPKALGDWARGLGGPNHYWAALEPDFRLLLRDLPGDLEHSGPMGPARLAWAKALRRIARTAFDSATSGFKLRARDLAAWAQAEQCFSRQLAQLLPEALLAREEVLA